MKKLVIAFSILFVSISGFSQVFNTGQTLKKAFFRWD